jgi:hypothetical protein
MSAKFFGAMAAMLVVVTPLAASAQPHRDHRADAGYGRWDKRWGAQPPAPPRHWTKKGDWYRHVRACQQRYRSYNPRTDAFEIRRGVTRRCAL